MRKRIITTLVISIGIILITILQSGFAQPAINSFAPICGWVGTTVTIRGTNFSPVASENIVYFGPVRGSISSATATSLGVTLPQGATCAPVSVTRNGLTGFSRFGFNVRFPSVQTFDASTFVSDGSLSAGSTVIDIATADFDSDGKIDVVAACGSDSSIAIFRNISTSGTLAFATKLNLPVGRSAAGVITADFDGDGKIDIAVRSAIDGGLVFFRNTSAPGSLSFAAPVTLGTGWFPRFGAVGDIDGDGKIDLVIADMYYDSVRVVRNVGSIGTFAFALGLTLPVSFPASCVAVGDIDGDNASDVCIQTTEGVTVYRNTSTPGNVTFASPVVIPTSATMWSFTLSDLDEDGKLDLIGTGDDSVLVARNTSSTGNILFGGWQPYASDPTPAKVAVADLDGDGRPDVAALSTVYLDVSVFKNMSVPGTIALGPKHVYGTTKDLLGIAIADLNSDGRPDYATVSGQQGTVDVMQNTMPPYTVIARYDKLWNLVSVPLEMPDIRRSVLYPPSCSQAFSYDGTYHASDTLCNGWGYWLRFTDTSTVTFPGTLKRDSIPLVTGWNLIPSGPERILSNAITTVPAGMITGSIYGYRRGYRLADTLEPGKGYWIKTRGPGQLFFGSSSMPKPAVVTQPLDDLNRLAFEDASGAEQVLYFGKSDRIRCLDFRLPPVPPRGIFDVRFVSDDLVALADSALPREVPIAISSAVCPLRVRWDVTRKSSAALLINGEIISLAHSGSRTLAEIKEGISLSIIPDPAPEVPLEYSLGQNYPNPFNPTATIRYQVPTASRVKLKIFNALGQEVTTLVDQTLDAGYKSVTWNASGVASSIYFYRLEATSTSDPTKSFTQVRKMLFLK